MLLKELEGTLTLFDGDTLSQFVRKEGVSSFDAQIGLNILKGLVKDSKVRILIKMFIQIIKDFSKFLSILYHDQIIIEFVFRLAVVKEALLNIRTTRRLMKMSKTFPQMKSQLQQRGNQVGYF